MRGVLASAKGRERATSSFNVFTMKIDGGDVKRDVVGRGRGGDTETEKEAETRDSVRDSLLIYFAPFLLGQTCETSTHVLRRL